MPYEYHWLDAEHSIIRLDIYGKVTWDQWREVTHNIAHEIKNVRHRVDLIFYDTVGMPKGNPVPHLKVTRKKLAENSNMGLFVTVSAQHVSAFVEMIVKVMRGTDAIPDTHYGGFVTTLEAALTIIHESRAKSQSNEVS